MKTLLIIILVLASISVIVTLYGKYDYIKYIKKCANKYSIEEIDTFIQKHKNILEEDVQDDRGYTDAILDTIELWEQVHKYKLYKKI